jgi:large repetitive protein
MALKRFVIVSKGLTGIKRAILGCLATLKVFSLVLTIWMLALPVNAGAQTAHFSYAPVTLGSGFYQPLGVTVDNNGNVFVADTFNNAVKEILAAGGYTTVNTLGEGFSLPMGVAVDGSGNVFVADYGNNAVKEILVAGGYTTVNTLGGGFSIPSGVAVDGNGDVFVADQGNEAVKEILAAGGYTTVNTLGGAFTSPSGVAVDGNGDVFVSVYDVAGSPNNAVKEILAAGGYTTVNTLGSGFVYPMGVALDGSGNVFVADYVSNNTVIKEILAAGGYTTVNTFAATGFTGSSGVAVDGSGNVLIASASGGVVELNLSAADFSTVAIGQTSATIPLTFTFDTGETIGSPVALTQGAAGLDFAVASGGTCTAGTYSTGATCTVDVTLSPKFAGLRYGAVLLQDGSGNTLATGNVYGIGLGPQVSFLPGSQSMVASGFNNPVGVAVDGGGNVFVGDTQNNAVKEIPSGCVTSSCIKTLAGGFYDPEGVAVDGSGNVFVADLNNSAVKEVLAAGGYTTVITLASGINGPKGVAVDGSGNVFFVDIGDSAVKEILAAGGYTTINTLGGGFSYPGGVAVDGSGNIFVGDTGNSAVKEILAAGGYTTINTLGGGFSYPVNVAVDASGNVFVADVGNGELKEILAAGGYTTVITLAGGVGSSISPVGVAEDASGNIFVGDSLNNLVVKLDYADAPSLNFGSMNVGVNSVEQTVTLQNIGNAPLTLPPPTAGSNPSVSQSFTLDSSVSTTCPVVTTSSSPGSLANGASCTLSISFDPTVSGNINGSVVLKDNALNAASPNYATQTIALQGSGIQQSQTISFPNPGTQTYGVPLTLSATATSGLPITYIVTSGPATVNGSTLTFTGVGSITVQANQPGNAAYSAAAPVAQTLTVMAPAYTVTPSVTTLPLSKGGSQAVTVMLASTTFADRITWTATTSSPLITVSPSSGSATLSANSSSTVSLTITASNSAANHAPRLPWTGGLIAFGAVLAGVPLAGRRKRMVSVLVSALAVSALPFMMSCGGGGGSNSTPPAPRNYTVTLSGTGGVSSTIAVTVQ